MTTTDYILTQDTLYLIKRLVLNPPPFATQCPKMCTTETYQTKYSSNFARPMQQINSTHAHEKSHYLECYAHIHNYSN